MEPHPCAIDDRYGAWFKTGFDANFSTALTTKVYMDYMFKGKRLKQIRHLLIPTISYTYRPNLAGSFNYYQSVQTATTGVTGRFSIFDNTIFGGPTYGLQNLLSVNLNNTLDAKVRQSTDSGYTFKKVNLLQNVGITGNYNFAADSLKMSQIGITARTKLWKFFDMTMASTFDPYVYDRQQKRVVNRYYYGETGKLARFTGGQLAINAVFSSGTVNTKAPPKLTNGAERNVDQTKPLLRSAFPGT